jgi:hypothetical protein
MWGRKLMIFTEVLKKSKLSFFKDLFISIWVASIITYSLPSAAFPVITDVKVKITGGDTADYTVTYQDDSSLDNLSALQAKVPQEMAKFGIFHRHLNWNSTIPEMGGSDKVVQVREKNLTWIQVAKLFRDSYGLSGTVIMQHGAGPNGNECVGLIGATSAFRPPWSEAFVPPFPQAQCVGTPPANNWCALKTSEITLDYGTLTSDKAVGAKKSANVIVECTDAIDYTLRLRGKGEIPLSNGMNVTLTANNSPLVSTTLHGAKGDNSVTIEGTLNGTPVDGAFTGSEVLMVSYP